MYLYADHTNWILKDIPLRKIGQNICLRHFAQIKQELNSTEVSLKPSVTGKYLSTALSYPHQFYLNFPSITIE